MARVKLISRWRSMALFGVLAGVCGSAFTAVYLWTVRTTPGRLLGDASLRGAMLTNSRTSELVDGVLAVVSTATLLGTVTTIAVIALIRLRRSPGLAAIGLLGMANASTWVLKNIALSRPDLGLRESTPATLNSLPSGHTTAAFSAVVAFLFVVPGRWRGPVAAVGAGYAWLTALATMSAGWHRAGDSLAAFLLVGFWAAVAGLVVVVVDGSGRAVAGRTSGIRRRWRRRAILIAAGTLTAGIALMVGLYAYERLREGTIAAVSAFTAGGLLMAGTASGVVLTVVAMLDQTESSPSRAAAVAEQPRSKRSRVLRG